MIEPLKKIFKRRSFPYLFFKIAVFFILLFLADFFVGNIFKHFFFKQTSGWEYRTKYSIEDTKADILIFGASRAQQQYNPVYFEERLNETCYNVGRDGEPIFYSYAVLQAILQRYKPKIIIFDVDNAVFMEKQSSYDRIAALLPFYEKHPEMRSVIELRGPFEKLKLQSHIYPYNSLLFKIAMGNTEFNKKRNVDIKGYVPLSNSLNEPIRKVDLSSKYPIDSNKVNCYKSFINDCIKANVKLYLVSSPYFFQSTGSDTSIALAKKIANEKNIEFIDFSKDGFFKSNSKLFDDTVHVNFAGSTIFCNRLIDTLISRDHYKTVKISNDIK